MKKSVFAALALSLVSMPAAFADAPHPHCFAIVSPRVCTAGPYGITIQGQDCFHTEVTGRVELNGRVITTLSGLQDRVEGAPADGLAPWVVYTGNNGFYLKTANGTGNTDGSEFDLDLPRAERISEQNVKCNY